MNNYLKLIFSLLLLLSVTHSFAQKNYGSQEIHGKWRMIEMKSKGSSQSDLDVQVLFPKGEECVIIENNHEQSWRWELKRRKLIIIFDSSCSPRVDTYQIEIKDNVMYWRVEDELITLQRIE